ncbi:MAG TPA: acyl carrier protein [Jatrophihabitans sp.]|nr:acyl carrier protein [Jatrophihabitans sp.]
MSGASRAEVSTLVKQLVLRESRLSIPPSAIADDEPLNGELLKVNSLGFLGMLVHLEDELDVQLPDDLFAGRTFGTVADLIDVVAGQVAGPSGDGGRP